MACGDPDRALRVRNWCVNKRQASTPAFVRVSLPWRKTDQAGGANCDLIIGETGSAICALAAMEKFLAARRQSGETITGESFLFPMRDTTSGPLRPISYARFMSALQPLLRQAGSPPESFNLTGHSFRIGAATAMAKHGVPDYWIETLGGWAPGSASMRSYLRLDDQARAKMSTFLTRPYTFADSVSSVVGPSAGDARASPVDDGGSDTSGPVPSGQQPRRRSLRRRSPTASSEP